MTNTKYRLRCEPNYRWAMIQQSERGSIVFILIELKASIDELNGVFTSKA